MIRRTKGWASTGLIIGLAIAMFVTAIGAPLLIGANIKPPTVAEPSDSPTSTPNPDTDTWTDEQIAQFEKLMTFHERTLECEVNELGLIETVIYAAPAYGPNSDATPKRTATLNLSVPLTGTNAAEYNTSQREGACKDSLAGLTQGYALGNLVIPGTTTRVFDIEGNEGLKLADVKVSQLNNLARDYVYEKGDDRDTFIKNNEAYQEYVSTYLSILAQFSQLGVHSLTSIQNWRLEGPSAGIANVVLSPDQESLPAILYGVTEKGQCVPGILFGINLQDQRPEVFSPSEYKQKICDTPPVVTPECTVDCGGTPECTGDCGTQECPPDMPYGNYPVCKDSPNNDPEVQGNNKPGGGGKAPVQEDPVGPPAAGNPPATYTPPVIPTPDPTTPPTGSTPDPAPAPVVDPVLETEEPETECVTAPGAAPDC